MHANVARQAVPRTAVRDGEVECCVQEVLRLLVLGLVPQEIGSKVLHWVWRPVGEETDLTSL